MVRCASRSWAGPGLSARRQFAISASFPQPFPRERFEEPPADDEVPVASRSSTRVRVAATPASQATYVLVPELRKPAVAPGSLSCDPQPRLQVDDLLLRPWHPDDAAALVHAYGDPSIQRWLVRSMNEREALEWVRSRADHWEQETGADWAVVRGDVVIGRVALRKLDLLDGVGEATYWVTPTARGESVASRGLRAMSEWFFARGDFHRIELDHSTLNPASCRVALRAGFAAEGTRRQAVLHADGWHDMHLHARLSTDGDERGPQSDPTAPEGARSPSSG